MSYDENRASDQIDHGFEKQQEWYEFLDNFIEIATEKGSRKPLVHGDLTFKDLLIGSPELNSALKMLHGGIDPYIVITDLCAIALDRNKIIDEKFKTGEWSVNMIFNKPPQHG